MARINYGTKTDAQISALPAAQKVSAADMNEIKASVNDMYDVRGWEHHADTTGAQVVTTTPALLTIDGLGAATNIDYAPPAIRGTGVKMFENNKILPINLGDSYDLRIGISLASKTASPNFLLFQLDIGGGASPTVVIAERAISTAKIPISTNISFPIFCLATFLANGGQLFVSCDAGTITLDQKDLMLVRTTADIS
jgi:hypothetical protein